MAAASPFLVFCRALQCAQSAEIFNTHEWRCSVGIQSHLEVWVRFNAFVRFSPLQLLLCRRKAVCLGLLQAPLQNDGEKARPNSLQVQLIDVVSAECALLQSEQQIRLNSAWLPSPHSHALLGTELAPQKFGWLTDCSSRAADEECYYRYFCASLNMTVVINADRLTPAPDLQSGDVQQGEATARLTAPWHCERAPPGSGWLRQRRGCRRRGRLHGPLTAAWCLWCPKVHPAAQSTCTPDPGSSKHRF